MAAVTKLEHDAVKADLAGDKAFYVKYLASDWTGGDSGGQWFTKPAMMKMMDDAKNNKFNSEEGVKWKEQKGAEGQKGRREEHLTGLSDTIIFEPDSATRSREIAGI